VDDGRFVAVSAAGTEPPPARALIEAHGAMASAPYVEPHVHLDTTLTAGQPR
jgi:cytosine/creatinine deaminase